MEGALFLTAISLPDDFPELGSDLVAALTSLQVDDFSHVDTVWEMSRSVVVRCVRLTEAGVHLVRTI